MKSEMNVGAPQLGGWTPLCHYLDIRKGRVMIL